MMENIDLDVVLECNELGEYLLGDGLKYGYVRPETGYQRWNHVADYYKSLAKNEENCIKIEQAILSLIEDNDVIHRITALEVSIQMEFKRIEPSVRNLIASISESSVDHSLLRAICKNVVRLWLEDAIIDLIPKMISYRSLTILFQAASPVVNDSRPTDSEIWVLDRMASIYNIGNKISEHEMQKSLRELLDEFNRSRRVLGVYLKDTVNIKNPFREMLIALMN